jgi:isocitrate dehydrogenase (NAD+)
MVQEGRAEYADPSSIIRAGVMLLQHIGFADHAHQLEMALDICGSFERKVAVSGRSSGAKSSEFTDYLLETLENPRLEKKWRGFQTRPLVA